jgi:hypothetical protein
VLNLLERVGDPEDIAAEARERFESNPVTRLRTRASWTDIATVALLVLGSLMITPFYRPEGTVVLWGAAIVLLWMSEVWSTLGKIGVTLVLPAGALSAVAIQGSGDEGFVYFAIILFAAIWPPAYLGRKLRKARLASEDTGIEAQNRFGIEPARTDERSRRTKWLIGGVLALVVLVGTVVVSLALSGGTDEPFGEPEITEAEFERVNLGDSKEEVSQTLGGPGDGGSIVAGLDPVIDEEPQDVGDQQFDDCWSYFLASADVGAGTDAAVCFKNSSDEVVYRRVRVAD